MIVLTMNPTEAQVVMFLLGESDPAIRHSAPEPHDLKLAETCPECARGRLRLRLSHLTRIPL